MSRFSGAGRGAVTNPDSYWEDDGPSSTSSRLEAAKQAVKEALNPPSTDEIDPFEAFMAEINTLAASQDADAIKKGKDDAVAASGDKPDPYVDAELGEGFNPAADASSEKYFYRGSGADYDSDEEVYAAAKAADAGVYDDDGNLIADGKPTSGEIEALPAVDHSGIKYEPFRRCFYTEAADVRAWPDKDVAEFKADLGIMASGHDVLKPIRSFMQAGFDAKLIHAIAKAEFEAPTAIQSQALPCALSGRDIIGIAQTGSGKTLAFLWPAIVHMMDQRELDVGDGPILLVLAPTRELVIQIHAEAKRFIKPYHMNVVALHGGVSKWEQQKALKAGCEAVIATPGRLIDLLHTKATNLRRVTYLVLDEADRMLDMGFEKQVRSILNTVRPDRQTLLFSATFRKRVEGLAKDAVRNPVRITVGHVGQSNENISQKVVVLDDDMGKWPWLVANLSSFLAEGKVLLFVANRAGCDELSANLSRHLPNGSTVVASIHGDRTQEARDDVIRKFKAGTVQIVIATDVASRGLDIKDVRTVINVDKARNMDTHVHRVGRTGRMGVSGVQPGVAYTLITKAESAFAGDLVHNLRKSKQEIPAALLELARSNPRFREYVPGASHHDEPPVDSVAGPSWGSVLASGGRSGGFHAPGTKFPGRGRGMNRGGLGFSSGRRDDPMASLHASSGWNHDPVSHVVNPSKPAMTGFVSRSVAQSTSTAPIPPAAPTNTEAQSSEAKKRSRWGDAPAPAPAPAPSIPGYNPGFNPNLLKRVRF